jgi:hypothetical protein
MVDYLKLKAYFIPVSWEVVEQCMAQYFKIGHVDYLIYQICKVTIVKSRETKR